jgi:hypothetical protein
MKRRAVHCTRPGNSLLLTGFASTPDARGDAKSKRIPDTVCSSHLMLVVMLRRLEGRAVDSPVYLNDDTPGKCLLRTAFTAISCNASEISQEDFSGC